MEYERFLLTNGIRAVATPTMLGSPVSLQVWFASGARVEKDEESGLSHFNEHMIFKGGGPDFSDAKSVQHALWLIGGQNNGATAQEFVVYFISVPAYDLSMAAHLFSDMIGHSAMKPADVELERGVILQEFKSAFDSHEDFADGKFEKLMFGKTRFGRDCLGTRETIGHFTSDDILRFKNRFYGPPNMVITVTGGFDPKDIRNLLEMHFGAFQEKEAVTWEPFRQESDLPPAAIHVREVINQSYINIGAPAPHLGSPNMRAQTMLDRLLFRRLWLKIREDRGLVYSVRARSVLHTDTGILWVDAEVDGTKKAVEVALGLMLKEMAAIKAGDVDEDEFRQIKTSMKASVALELESSFLIGRYHGIGEMLLGKTEPVGRVYDKIDEVTLDDILRLSRENWQEQMVRSSVLAPQKYDYEKMFCTSRRVLR